MNSKCIILAIVLIASCVDAKKPNTVVIRNTLGHNKKLKIHCKSKNDDLGVQIVGIDKSYSFSFNDNFFQTTLLWCNLWQGPNYKHHQVFVAYKAGSFPRFGAVYLWDAREEGIYLLKDDDPGVFKYEWDIPHK